MYIEAMSSRLERVQALLAEAFEPTHIEVVNESHMHSVPPGSETHLRVVIVSARFEGLRSVQRQRWIYDLLRLELSSGLHALSQRTYTPAEWIALGGSTFLSPECASKS